DVADHWLAGDILQRLARQAAGCVTRRNHYGKGGAHLSRRSSTSRVRASPSSITGMPSRTGNARASTLQISSDLSSATFNGPLHIFSDLSSQALNGPLHSGQARISSSLVSMCSP